MQWQLETGQLVSFHVAVSLNMQKVEILSKPNRTISDGMSRLWKICYLLQKQERSIYYFRKHCKTTETTDVKVFGSNWHSFTDRHQLQMNF